MALDSDDVAVAASKSALSTLMLCGARASGTSSPPTSARSTSSTGAKRPDTVTSSSRALAF